jgi:hypothetical protein
MTKAEAITYLNSIIPQQVNMITLDAAKWAECKAVVISVLNDPAVDPKYKLALEQVNTIVVSTLT